jgi:predicted NAD/FAD-dependent oxidoreductase
MFPQGLAKHAMKAVVFDTGEHGVGGRAATRATLDPSIHSDWISKDSSSVSRAAGLVFDHAAQCFTATDAAFQQQCEEWVAAGAAKRWQGQVGTLKPGGVFEPLDPSVAVYVATDGMRQLAEYMAEQVRTKCLL